MKYVFVRVFYNCGMLGEGREGVASGYVSTHRAHYNTKWKEKKYEPKYSY